MHSDEQNAKGRDGRFMRVCVRKRPFFPHEKQQGEYDVVSCAARDSIDGATASAVVVHDARMHANMTKMYMTHHAFSFDGVFGGAASNEQVSSSLL